MSSAGTACCTGRMGAEKDKRRLHHADGLKFQACFYLTLFMCISLFFFFFENVHVDALLVSKKPTI